jgi:8-oxo-dGTP diphosphatase
VQRPDDDEDLPGVWGLPAASLAPGEDCTDAAQRVGRAKLGVQLDIGDVLNAGVRQRADYVLSMRLIDARIREGTPDPARAPVPAGSTRYQAWRWGAAEDVRPAAERGSLCSRLLLEL